MAMISTLKVIWAAKEMLLLTLTDKLLAKSKVYLHKHPSYHQIFAR